MGGPNWYKIAGNWPKIVMSNAMRHKHDSCGGCGFGDLVCKFVGRKITIKLGEDQPGRQCSDIATGGKWPS